MSEKIGIYVCECGPNISSRVHIDRVVDEIQNLEDFKDKELVVKKHKLLCSVEGKKFLENEINENELTHLICAACSPTDHDSTFIGVCKKTKLNPYMYKIINIREQCAWIISDKERATDKAIKYIHSGMSRVLYQEPLHEKQIDINPDVLVVGAGISGIETALTLAGKDRKVFLIEKDPTIGGKANKLHELLHRQGVTPANLKRKISKVKSNPNIYLHTDTTLENIVGFLGNFEIVLSNNKSKQQSEILAGAVVLANGYDLFDSSSLENYNYSDADNVFTAEEAERMFKENSKLTLRNGEEPSSVALIHCVGRKEVGYCSKICCSYLQKIAHNIKDYSPNIEVIDLYKDMCLPNKEDDHFYKTLKRKGIDFIRYEKIQVNGSEIIYTKKSGEEKTTSVDMVIIAPAMIPDKSNKLFAELLNLDSHETGFFQETHIKINPVATNTDGIFIAGANRSPCGISEAIIQAQAAAGKISTQLVPGEKIIPEVMVSEVLEAYCTGCKSCLDVCKYGAIYYDERRAISIVNAAICRGCGNCVGACPSGSIRTKHFTNSQLYQEVKEALR